MRKLSKWLWAILTAAAAIFAAVVFGRRGRSGADAVREKSDELKATKKAARKELEKAVFAAEMRRRRREAAADRKVNDGSSSGSLVDRFNK